MDQVLRSLAAQDLAMKFTGLCKPKLGEGRTQAALKLWQNIEDAANVREAFDALNLQHL
jgi:hypothetical protein